MTDGLPDSQFGRCGLDIYRKDPNVVYAVVQTDKTPVGQCQRRRQRQRQRRPRSRRHLPLRRQGQDLEAPQHLCPRPFYFGQIRVDPNDDKRIYVLGVNMFVSNDGGKTLAAARAGRR